ncbi:winged helix-turn-helix domain-containing protein [Mameliella alba]|nr:winged helix-turn-helix domain-containing protein [Antarctobacter heliothermus]MBY6147011.1 winged helix-turn-helix domain-containing protein [Mameliella alba]MCA0956871.1 tetratricopeptide repeat protein [Mameliella alba]
MKIYEIKKTGHVLDGSNGALTDESGKLVELRPQTREVLRLLAASPNRTVTKAEFTAAVWEGRAVGDDSLVQCIAEIRSVLEDGGRRIIQTVPRKGYRFVPPEAPRQGLWTPIRKRAAVVAGGVLTCLVALALVLWPGRDAHTRAPVVAVLPLEDLSPTPQQGYLSDALAEGIITELARFPQFLVIARNSSFQFRDKPTDVRRIGRALGAGYVVEGSQQFDGTRLRVTVQLVETASGAHVFADSYERDLHDLFAVQNEIVRQVASVVGQSLLTDLPIRTAERGVDSRLRGLQARKLMSQLSHENWVKALALERTSIREEPDSAWGYIGTSLMLGVAAQTGWIKPRDEVLAEAVDLAETAMRLAPENYMSQFTMGRVLSRTGQLQEAVLHFERAAELNPSDSLVLIGMSRPLLHLGQTDRAIEVLFQAKAVDPLHGDWLRWQLGWAYWQKGDCEEALTWMQSMSSPPVPSAKTLATIHVCLGQIPEARAALQRFLDKEPGYGLREERAWVPTAWQPEGIRERYLDQLRQAGMPD